jgi:signal transduction histidine kinase
MPAAQTVADSAAPLAAPAWLALERMTPFDAFAQAMGSVMLVIALLQWLSSRYADGRALRIFAGVYLLTGLGWLLAHPRAHGGASDVPLLPALVAVALLGLNVWGLYEFLGLARRRARRVLGGTVAAGAALALWLRIAPHPLAVYGVMAGAFAYCAWLAARAARHEGNVGHLYAAGAYASYPLLFALYLLRPQAMRDFAMAYYAAVPGVLVGMTLLAVSLIRARQRTEAELRGRTAAEDSLRRLNATLEERVASRTRELADLVDGLESFNRNVSHDLRDPLAGVSGLAQLGTQALQQGDTARALRHLDTIHAQARQMSGMVQDLLQLSHAAVAPLRRQRHGLREVLDEALAQLRLQPPMADALRRVQLQVDALPVCEVDADLLRLVFVNLVGNALKFTAARDGAGHVTVGLRRTPQGAAVSVEDDGAGLPAGREAELFKPFVRLHGQDVPGSGVGLTIVRRIVEAHGGRVWAERADSGGARFLFTLRGLTA